MIKFQSHTCGTKVHYTKVKKGSKSTDPARMCWGADGPNGPDMVPDSLSVLMTWWQAESNYNQY